MSLGTPGVRHSVEVTTSSFEWSSDAWADQQDLLTRVGDVLAKLKSRHSRMKSKKVFDPSSRNSDLSFHLSDWTGFMEYQRDHTQIGSHSIKWPEFEVWSECSTISKDKLEGTIGRIERAISFCNTPEFAIDKLTCLAREVNRGDSDKVPRECLQRLNQLIALGHIKGAEKPRKTITSSKFEKLVQESYMALQKETPIASHFEVPFSPSQGDSHSGFVDLIEDAWRKQGELYTTIEQLKGNLEEEREAKEVAQKELQALQEKLTSLEKTVPTEVASLASRIFNKQTFVTATIVAMLLIALRVAIHCRVDQKLGISRSPLATT